MHSLWTKLMGAFVLVILVGTGAILVLVGQATTGQFELYITRTGQQWAARLAPVAANYYTRTGHWTGVETVLRNPWGENTTSGMMGSGMMMDEMGDWSGHGANDSDMMDSMGAMFSDRLILTQVDGTVVVDTSGSLMGSRLQSADITNGAPITMGGARIGTLLITPLDTPSTPAGDFLGAVKRSVLVAGLAAATLAIFLGSILFVQITRPLRNLSRAAQGIAEGDLEQRVRVGSRDEVGQVALAFNRMAETLQQYATERRNMISDVAHELRTPLSVIQGNLEAMLDGVLPTTTDELALLHQETLLLNRLIDDLRTLSLAETGQLHLQVRPFEPGMLVQQVVERMRLSAQEKNISLQTEIGGDLPTVSGDPDRLTQVMTNLVDNAVRYNPAGTHVIVGACAVSQGVELSVSDNGPGIPAGEVAYLFDRFWRAEKSRNRATGGSGLGLAIVKQLVEAHQGQVLVESQIGKGTRFRVQLPAA